MCRPSADRVHQTATMDTANQEIQTRYRRARNWSASATAKTTVPTTPASTRPYRRARKSEVASPIAVVRILMIQKYAVIRYGTLLARDGVGTRGSSRRS